MTTTTRWTVAGFVLAALTGCGGGGDDAGNAGGLPPVATSATAGTARYGQTLLVTVQGSRLDQGT